MLENKQLKEYIANVKKRYQKYQHLQQQEQYPGDREYFERKPQKKYKKVVYEEEIDSEPEVEENQYTPEEEFIEEEEKQKEQKQQAPKRKNTIFDYLNKDAKRNKR